MRLQPMPNDRKSDARTDRTPKALCEKAIERACSVSRQLLECARVLASLLRGTPALRGLLLAGALALTATVSRADSEIVIAIRYLQPKGTSHSHLYLYREDGKLLRQLTNDSSGQDMDPIFAPDGEMIVFTREKPNDTREFWSVDPLGKKLKKLDNAPDWYAPAKNPPASTETEEEGSSSDSTSQGTASPPPATEAQEESASPGARSESSEQGAHQSVTALDAVADAKEHPPETIKAPDGSGEIFWRKDKEGEATEEELDWVMWYRDLKSGQETEIGRLPAFPSFEPLKILFDGPLRLAFFSTHLDSQSGSTVMAFDFNKQKLIRLSPNWAAPIPLPGEAAFLTLTENRYVPIPGTTKTAICSYIERWGADIKEDCSEKRWAASISKEFFEDESWRDIGVNICAGEPEVRYARKGSAAICYGASMYRPGKDPAVVIIPSGGD